MFPGERGGGPGSIGRAVPPAFDVEFSRSSSEEFPSSNANSGKHSAGKCKISFITTEMIRRKKKFLKF